MLSLFQKKILHYSLCPFELISLKYFQNFLVLCFCFVLFSSHKVRIKSIHKFFLEQHFTLACIYYSVIWSKTFSSLSGLKMRVTFHLNFRKMQIPCKFTVHHAVCFRDEYFQLFPDNHPGIVLKNRPIFGIV